MNKKEMKLTKKLLDKNNIKYEVEEIWSSGSYIDGDNKTYEDFHYEIKILFVDKKEMQYPEV